MRSSDNDVDELGVFEGPDPIWLRAAEALKRARSERHRWLVPLIEEMQKYPRLRALRPFISHFWLALSETPSYPYLCHRLPAGQALAEGWFRVERHRKKPRGILFWRPVEHTLETVGEGNAATAAKLMDALVAAEFGSPGGE